RQLDLAEILILGHRLEVLGLPNLQYIRAVGERDKARQKHAAGHPQPDLEPFFRRPAHFVATFTGRTRIARGSGGTILSCSRAARSIPDRSMRVRSSRLSR